MPNRKFYAIERREQRKFIVTMTVYHGCNLNCRYCYERRANKDTESMDFEIAKNVITRFMEADNGFDNNEFQFFGGEPMMVFPLIKKIVDWFHTHSWKKGHIFFICTNGTILTEEMKGWLTQNKQCVTAGISLDGNKTAHDTGRSNSYDLLLRNLPFFKETWPTQPAKMTIYSETIPYVADSIIELEEMGLHFTANIVFENIWGNAKQKKNLLGMYKKQLIRLVDYYACHPHLEPVGPLLQRDLEYINLPNRKIKVSDGDCQRYCGAGHEMVMVEVDGTIFPCHRFANWITNSTAPTIPINIQKIWKPESCAQCNFITICPTCAGFNWELNGDTGIRTTYHCEAFKLELWASAQLQAIRLGQCELSDLLRLSEQEKSRIKRRLEWILEFSGKEL